jgi:hypothetical protein
MPYRVARCAEFPNDNPSLHRGAIWICAEIGAGASCELPPPDEAASDAVEVTVGLTSKDLPGAEPEEEGGIIEVVEDLTFEDTVEEQTPEDARSSKDPETTSGDAPDAFEAFVRVLAEVAGASGADARAVTCLRALLGQSRLDGIALEESVTEALVAGALVVRAERGLVRAPGFTSLVLAWQGILRGESEDFGPCGAVTLDEWSANVVASVLGTASRAEGIRRDLRRRGVAAFGFIADAA